METNLIRFSAVALVGILTIILGFRINQTWRRTLVSAGVVFLHVGVFGIIYFTAPHTLFVSTVALMLSIFVLLDPFKFSTYMQVSVWRNIGLLLLFTATGFFTMFLTGFPVQLWIVPLTIYLIPYILPPFKPKQAWFHRVSWVIVALYVGLVSFSAYNVCYPNPRYGFLVNWFTKPQINATFTAPSSRPALTTDTNSQRASDKATIPVEKSDGTTTKEEISVNQAQALPLPDVKVANVTPGPKAPAFDDNTANNDSASDLLPSNLNDEEGPYLQSLKSADEQYLRLKRNFERLQKKYNDLEQENLHLQLEIKKNQSSTPAAMNGN